MNFNTWRPRDGEDWSDESRSRRLCRTVGIWVSDEDREMGSVGLIRFLAWHSSGGFNSWLMKLGGIIETKRRMLRHVVAADFDDDMQQDPERLV